MLDKLKEFLVKHDHFASELFELLTYKERVISQFEAEFGQFELQKTRNPHFDGVDIIWVLTLIDHGKHFAIHGVENSWEGESFAYAELVEVIPKEVQITQWEKV